MTKVTWTTAEKTEKPLLQHGCQQLISCGICFLSWNIFFKETKILPFLGCGFNALDLESEGFSRRSSSHGRYSRAFSNYFLCVTHTPAFSHHNISQMDWLICRTQRYICGLFFLLVKTQPIPPSSPISNSHYTFTTALLALGARFSTSSMEMAKGFKMWLTTVEIFIQFSWAFHFCRGAGSVKG